MAGDAENIASLQATIGADTTSFTDALGQVQQALGGLGGMIPDLSFGSFLTDAVHAASDEQDALNKLGQTVSDYNAQTVTVTEATGHFATVTESLGPKAQKAADQVELLTAKIHDQEANLSKAKGSHQAMLVTIDQEKEKIAQLTSQYDLHSGPQQTFIHDTEQQTIAAQLSTDQLVKMADAYAQTTDFSKDTVINSEAVLATFHDIGANVFPQAQGAILDVAQVMGGDLQGATVQVGKALNDPLKGYTALQRIGVTFSDTEKEQIKQFMAVNDVAGAQGVIIGELNSEFGGAAVAAGQTFSGQLDILGHSLNDNILVPVGDAILPILTSLVDGIGNIVNTLQNADPGFLAFAGVAILAAGALGLVPVVLGAIGAVIGVILSPIGLVVGAVLALKLAFDTNFLGIRDTVNNIIGQITPVIQGITSTIQGVADLLSGNQMQTTFQGHFHNKGTTGDDGSGQATTTHDKGVQSAVGKDFGDRLGMVISEAAPKILAAIQDVIQGAWTWLTTDGVAKLGDAVHTLMDWGGKILDKVPDLISSISQFIGKAFDWLIKEGPLIIGQGIRTIFDVGKTLVTAAGDLVSSVRDWLTGAKQWLSDNGPSLIQGAITDVFDLGKTITDAIPGFILHVGDFIQGAVDWIKNTGATIFVNALAGIFGVDPSVITAAIGPVLKTVTDEFDKIFGDKGTLATGFDIFKKDIWDPVFGPGGLIDNVGSALSTAFQDVVNIITQPFKDAVAKIADLLISIGNSSAFFSSLVGVGEALKAIVNSSSSSSANLDIGQQNLLAASGQAQFNASGGLGEQANLGSSAQSIRGSASRGSSAQGMNFNGATLHFHGVQDVQSLYVELQKLTGYKNQDSLVPAWS